MGYCGGVYMKMYKLYRIDMTDQVELMGIFDDEDKAKLMRNVCYSVDEKSREEGEPIELGIRYCIISD